MRFSHKDRKPVFVAQRVEITSVVQDVFGGKARHRMKGVHEQAEIRRCTRVDREIEMDKIVARNRSTKGNVAILGNTVIEDTADLRERVKDVLVGCRKARRLR